MIGKQFTSHPLFVTHPILTQWTVLIHTHTHTHTHTIYTDSGNVVVFWQCSYHW